jgi:hypothetical protein
MKNKKIDNQDVEKMLTYFEETALFEELTRVQEPISYIITNDDNVLSSTPENNGIIIVKPFENGVRLYYSKYYDISLPIVGDGRERPEEEVDFYSKIEFESNVVKINSTYRKKYLIDANDEEARLQKGMGEEVKEEEGLFYLDSSGRLCFKSNLNRELTLYSTCNKLFGQHVFVNGLGRKLKSLIPYQN